MKKLLLTILTALVITACSDATVVSKNLSKAADNFEVHRRIVFYNGITDNYILEVQGLCSFNMNESKTAFNVICKTGDNDYKKHTLVLSDNVTAFSEQIESKNVSKYHYKVIFKPSVIIPDVSIK